MNGRMAQMIQFRITPDRSVANKKVHEMFRSLTNFYASPLDILQGKKLSGSFWWDVMIRNDEVQFFCTFPSEWKSDIKLQIENIWPLCSLEEVSKQTNMPAGSDICEMKYRRNNIFSLQTDRRMEYEPLGSLLSIQNEMASGELARFSLCAEPVSRLDWQTWAERMHREFRQGKTPRRTRLSKRDILVTIGEAITGVLQSLVDTVHVALTHEPNKRERADDYEKRTILIDGDLSRGTVNKLKAPTFNTYLRLASHSSDISRQQILLRTMSNSFNDLTCDNELVREDFNAKLKPMVLKEINEHRLSFVSRLDWDKNKMSNEELGRLCELPCAHLQDTYQMETLENRQLEVPAIVRSGGIPLGDVKYKKQSVPVYIPTSNHDQLCLPTCVIGGMGSGKTKGLGCNTAIGYVQSGYSAIIFDPAKSEVWDSVSKKLPANQRQRILLGDKPIALDFREVLHSPKAKGRLAQIILHFFDDNTDSAGAQTQRFLRAAVMAMSTGKLSEIVKILTDDAYRTDVIRALDRGMTRDTLEQFGAESEARKRQILSPILNRLDVILGDPYLEACMQTDNGIDMVEILSKRGVCTVVDVPDRLNTRAAKDLLINLISFKIDAAMSLRKDEFPFAVIYDEPHQYLRSASLWENVAVESRKYRLAYTWMFHSWEQIPSKLKQIIKDANPHYVLYNSSEETFKGLKNVIAPFTIEDGLHIPRFHAICALKFGDRRLMPFMAKMASP